MGEIRPARSAFESSATSYQRTRPTAGPDAGLRPRLQDLDRQADRARTRRGRVQNKIRKRWLSSPISPALTAAETGDSRAQAGKRRQRRSRCDDARRLDIPFTKFVDDHWCSRHCDCRLPHFRAVTDVKLTVTNVTNFRFRSTAARYAVSARISISEVHLTVYVAVHQRQRRTGRPLGKPMVDRDGTPFGAPMTAGLNITQMLS